MLSSHKIWLFILVGTLASGCLADRNCLIQADCPQGKVCRDGQCRFECDNDGHCVSPQRCVGHTCKLPSGCQGCFFPNAEMTCDDTTCSMLGCHPNWWDHNLEPSDGCETYCEPLISLTESEPNCDEVDEDCDGRTDEGFDLVSDPQHCGTCSVVCPIPPHSDAVCDAGDCRYHCLDGYFDNNGEPEDGCEDEECVPTSPLVDEEPDCDNKDDDCDGVTDEGWDKTVPDHCGLFCTDCHEALEHSVPACLDSKCVIDSCLAGYEDANALPQDGCECELTNNGIEMCDGQDNDCDNSIDEGLNCCPTDMTQVDPVADCEPDITKPFCIDIFEATLWQNQDCSGEVFNNKGPMDGAYSCAQIDNLPAGFAADVGFTSDENDKVYSCSVKGIVPSRCLSWFQAKRACENSGKRLCSPEEWALACRGSECTEYPYGNDFTWDICNYIETYNYVDFLMTFMVLATGTMEQCLSGFGVYDISGNVWEHDSAGVGHVRGGAYNCNQAGAPMLESCTKVTTFSDLLDPDGNPTGSRNNVGFRCCK
jgi:hypothetical protein